MEIFKTMEITQSVMEARVRAQALSGMSLRVCGRDRGGISSVLIA